MKLHPPNPSFVRLFTLLALALLCSVPASVRAATFTVTKTADTADGTCNADCSLREAITAANNAGGADQVNVPAGTYTLTRVGKDDLNSTGDLDIRDTLTIVGTDGNPANTIIQAGTTSTNGIDLVFQVNTFAETASATFQALTIQNGRNANADTFIGDEFNHIGCAIAFYGGNADSLSLTVSNCVINNNSIVNTSPQATSAGIYYDSGPNTVSGGSLTVSNTLFTGNKTNNSQGGAIGIFGDHSTINITGCTFTANEAHGGANGEGGAIFVRQNGVSGTATVGIHNCLINNNTSESRAGGIKLECNGSMNTSIDQGTIITGNASTGSFSAVSGTTGASEGGGLYDSRNGGTTTLANVEISSNTATKASSAQANGGGLYSNVGAMSLTNVTISGNQAAADGGGVRVNNSGAGANGVVTCTNVTISNNRADTDNNGTGAGGGISRGTVGGATGTATLRNTIVGGNFNDSTGTTADDVGGTLDSSASAHHNLIGTGGSGGLTNGANSNIVGVAVRLAALANNGGTSAGVSGNTAAIQTHALLSGSPAFDNGDGTLATATDQRGTGYTRVLDGPDADTTDEIDIGALEQHPGVEDIADKSTNEDVALPQFSFNVGDSNLTSGLNTITVTSSNTTIVPNANIKVDGGSNSVSNSTLGSHTLDITPVADQHTFFSGPVIITVTLTDTYNSLSFSIVDTFNLTVVPIADPPVITPSPGVTDEDVQTSGLVISRNPVDGAEVTHFKITGITGGTLFQNNGTTQINNTDFITFAQANTSGGLKFTPAANQFGPSTNFKFDVQGATNGSGAGLGLATTEGITVNPVADTPSVTDTTTVLNTQTTSGLVLSRNAVDGAEIGFFKITGITNGTLFQHDGTTQINNGDFITFAQGNTSGGLRFTPNNGLNDGSFIVQASVDNIGTGLSAGSDTANITVNELPSLIVTISGDVLNPKDSQTSLREAINYANLLPNVGATPDTISFNITLGSAPFTISPTTNLPDVIEAVLIDGTTQSGYTDHPIVQLSGTGAGAGLTGLRFFSSGSTVRGLALGNFTTALDLNGSGGHHVENCYIGVVFAAPGGPTNGTSTPNGTGVSMLSANNVAGLDKNGVGAANRIWNSSKGVVVTSTVQGNTARGNSWRGNTINIDLNNNGVTANDLGDGDANGNNTQNFPVLTSAVMGFNNTNTLISGTLNSTANRTFRLDFYRGSTTGGAPDANSTGTFYLGSTLVSTDGSGNLATPFSFDAGASLSGVSYGATATDTVTGDTSEFSALLQQDGTKPTITIGQPTVLTTGNNFPQIQGTATDNLPGVTVRLNLIRLSDGFYWNGTTFVATPTPQTNLPTSPPSGGPGNWNSTGNLPLAGSTLLDNKYQIVAYAIDTSGNQSVASKTLSYDLHLPTVSITTPGSGAASGSQVDVTSLTGGISGSSAHTGVGIKKVTLKLTRNSDNFQWSGSQWVSGAGPAQYVTVVLDDPVGSSPAAWHATGTLPTVGASTTTQMQVGKVYNLSAVSTDMLDQASPAFLLRVKIVNVLSVFTLPPSGSKAQQVESEPSD